MNMIQWLGAVTEENSAFQEKKNTLKFLIINIIVLRKGTVKMPACTFTSKECRWLDYMKNKATMILEDV